MNSSSWNFFASSDGKEKYEWLGNFFFFLPLSLFLKLAAGLVVPEIYKSIEIFGHDPFFYIKQMSPLLPFPRTKKSNRKKCFAHFFFYSTLCVFGFIAATDEDEEEEEEETPPPSLFYLLLSGPFSSSSSSSSFSFGQCHLELNLFTLLHQAGGGGVETAAEKDKSSSQNLAPGGRRRRFLFFFSHPLRERGFWPCWQQTVI